MILKLIFDQSKDTNRFFSILNNHTSANRYHPKYFAVILQIFIEPTVFPFAGLRINWNSWIKRVEGPIDGKTSHEGHPGKCRACVTCAERL